MLYALCLFGGALVGAFTMALCHVAADADRDARKHEEVDELANARRADFHLGTRAARIIRDEPPKPLGSRGLRLQ